MPHHLVVWYFYQTSELDEQLIKKPITLQFLGANKNN